MYSLSSIFEMYATQTKKTNDAMLWIMTKIDYPRLFNRLWYANIYPNKTVKFVLLEYDYTEWSYVKKGNPNIIERMPNSNVLVHHAMKNPDFLRIMNQLFQFNERNVTVYIRQKIGSDGQPNFHRKQLVVMFDPVSTKDDTDVYSTTNSDI